MSRKDMGDLWDRVPSKSESGDRHIGCPVRWLKLVLPAVGGAKLAVALYLYRLRVVQHSRTVAVPNGWLRDELGISRRTKYKALTDLERAGIIRIQRKGREAPTVTFLR
jgi:DNA-binding transcriptional ArsR family regulator